jgi:AcrR family transcriptional regulator
MARKPAPDTRERILTTTTRLFTEHGIRAIGMQRIIDETGIGKNLLYREFAGKDDLVVAYLERLRAEWAAKVADQIDPLDDDPAAQLVALTRLHADQAAERRCPFRSCYSEFPDPTVPAVSVAGSHLDGVRRMVHRIAKRTATEDPQRLGDRVWLIIEGMYAASAHPGGRRSTRTAVAMVEELVAGNRG